MLWHVMYMMYTTISEYHLWVGYTCRASKSSERLLKTCVVLHIPIRLWNVVLVKSHANFFQGSTLRSFHMHVTSCLPPPQSRYWFHPLDLNFRSLNYGDTVENINSNLESSSSGLVLWPSFSISQVSNLVSSNSEILLCLYCLYVHHMSHSLW